MSHLSGPAGGRTTPHAPVTRTQLVRACWCGGGCAAVREHGAIRARGTPVHCSVYTCFSLPHEVKLPLHAVGTGPCRLATRP